MLRKDQGRWRKIWTDSFPLDRCERYENYGGIDLLFCLDGPRFRGFEYDTASCLQNDGKW